jgi:SAM-dependent methyltransferase
MSVDPRAPTQRFSDRVDFYVRYRPHYPRALAGHLAAEAGLSEASVVADVGSGTGFLSEVFLCHGCTVYGIEPNAEMRAAGEALLAPYPRFHSREGTAEATGLPDASVDWVVAGQALHWFDIPRARAEFLRILRPGGQVAICWNHRSSQASAFMRGYDELLSRHAPEYKDASHRKVGPAEYERLFSHTRWREASFPNAQRYDREGLHGRLRSSSYTPPPGHPGHEPMLAALDALFDAHQSGGQVAIAYVTQAFWGELA